MDDVTLGRIVTFRSQRGRAIAVLSAQSRLGILRHDLLHQHKRQRLRACSALSQTFGMPTVEPIEAATRRLKDAPGSEGRLLPQESVKPLSLAAAKRAGSWTRAAKETA